MREPDGCKRFTHPPDPVAPVGLLRRPARRVLVAWACGSRLDPDEMLRLAFRRLRVSVSPWPIVSVLGVAHGVDL